MGRKNQQQALLAGPPVELTVSQQIGKVETINGNNIYTVILPEHESKGTSDKGTTSKLVELPSKFRNSMWIRRGGYVLVDLSAFEARENKLAGEIVTVIHDEKSWRKMEYWPEAFQIAVAGQATEDQEDEGSDTDSLAGQGNPNRRRRYDSSDEE